MTIILKKIAQNKTPKVRQIILDGLNILQSVGVTLNDLTPRRLEKMAMVFLAVANMRVGKNWDECSSANDNHILKTRSIITYINEHFEENISPGSYDDIRRKDLVRLVGMNLVNKSANNPDADTNDGTRGYGLPEKFRDLIRTYSTLSWEPSLNSFEIDEEYRNFIEGKRQVNKLPVRLADGVELMLDSGPHNKIQKAVIEDFLPNYGYNATVLYIGDTSNKLAHKYSDRMVELGLDIQDRGMLPDIVAYSAKKNWIYLIEAVHSSNPLNPERCIELQRTVLKNCKIGIVYVTAFLSKKDFKKWFDQIAWETEVWIVDAPEHLIHFNGDKFMGPHNATPSIEP